MEKWLKLNKIKAFYENLTDENFRIGCGHLFQTAGLGKLRPNVLLMGFDNKWLEKNFNEIEDYVGIIRLVTFN